MIYTYTESDGKVILLIYFDEIDFSHVTHDNMEDSITGEAIWKMHNLMKEILPKFNFHHPYLYGQAKFSYPLFGQKLETVTEFKKENATMSMNQLARNIVTELFSQFYNDILDEYRRVSHHHYLQYVTHMYSSALERAILEGEVRLILQSSQKEICDPLLKKDFEDDIVCITYKDNGPVLLHEVEENVRQIRDANITYSRSKTFKDGFEFY